MATNHNWLWFLSGQEGDEGQPLFNDIFPALITGVATGSGTWSGLNLYSWNEAEFDVSTSIYTAVADGRAGDATVPRSIALEINNQLLTNISITHPVVWMRFRGIVYNPILQIGDLVYEFMAPLLNKVAVLTYVECDGNGNFIKIYTNVPIY